jgi:S-(hydroxymethyl)glutathione synthase
MFHWLRGLTERFRAQQAAEREQPAAGRHETMATAGDDFRAVGGCRCDHNPVRFEYTKRPFETHFCCCTDCTDICGGALALIAVVERDAFRVTQGESKIKNYDTKPTCHRRFCGECGCHMFLHVDAFPDFVLVHVPTLDRESEVGKAPDRWVFIASKHSMVMIPDDGLPRHRGWADSVDAAQAPPAGR